MLTANIDGNRSRPLPGAIGTCPFCHSEMIPRCGEVRVHHWAHKSIANCDPWREPETDWHREWKNEFPLRWQEKILNDKKTGERHIADVHTLSGLTVEVQHSRLDPKERRARESFYQDMIWIVDASRLAGNRKKILNWRQFMARIIQGRTKTNLYLSKEAQNIFPDDWLSSPVPVCFDYMGPKSDPALDGLPLFLLYPGSIGDKRLVEPLPRDGLLRSILSEQVSMNSVRDIMHNVSRLRIR
ncbi:competence protein CoiA family protein [Ruegeria profundi]|uniref:competence protein CoiA n=1 Tax=Ruegeria profundi TaxID=1685378 RepID=UPI003C7EB332